ncbi:MAG: T9SS type A sorting domain-containing protein [Bacteroidota bacterium]|nr:T9SS type A sorting domain-containing protein [Bacteroidota bacterium]
MKKIFILLFSIFLLANYSKAQYADNLWLTHYLLNKKFLKNNLLNSNKNLDELTDNRPVINNELIYHSVFFDFHYTITGTDAVNTTDENQNGIPDYIENMASVFDSVHKIYQSRGFAMPPPDNSTGGSDNFDVYVCNLDLISKTVLGYTALEDYIGDNPNSKNIHEAYSYSSYMVMRNNYNGFSEAPVNNIKSTAAHEFMHAIQAGYSIYIINDLWFSEMIAVWAEDYIYPELNGAIPYLYKFFLNTDVSLNFNEKYSYPKINNYYGTWIFAKYLTEHTSDTIIKNIYERIISSNNIILAISKELSERWGITFEQLFRNFIIANAVLESDSSYSPYNYSKASDYNSFLTKNGVKRFEKTFNYNSTPINYKSNRDGNGILMHLSSDYIKINSTGNFTITYSPKKNNLSDIILLKYGINNKLTIQNSDSINNDKIIQVNDNSNNSSYILIVYRINSNFTDSSSLQYTINIADQYIGINNNILNKQENISIYPNPIVNDYININVNYKVENLNINIYNLTGDLLYKNTFNNTNQVKAYISDFPNGLYVITIGDKKNILKREKLIICHK